MLLLFLCLFSFTARALETPIDVLMRHETYIVRDGGDPEKLTGDTTNQKKGFRPESSQLFKVKSYWVPADKVDAFEAANLPAELKQLFFRQVDGKNQTLFLVHPESEKYYNAFLKGSQKGEDFVAQATSSGRTTLVFRKSNPSLKFFAKLSLDRLLGDVRRTIKKSEIAKSIGINNLFAEMEQQRGHSPIIRFSEVLGFMPKGMDRGGFLIRTFPSEMQGRAGDSFIPAFSIYADQKNGTLPILAQQIETSILSPAVLVRLRIIRPFIQDWIKLAVFEGISSEAHAQNILIKRSADGVIGYEYAHRDFGGFSVDFDAREKMGLETPKNLPFYDSFKKTYGERSHKSNTIDYLSTYFVGGFIYDLDKRIPQWFEEGLVSSNLDYPNQLQDIVREELGLALSELIGRPVKVWKDFRNIPKLIKEIQAREIKNKNINPCFNLLKF